MGVTRLTPVIKIDLDKCINCYACIAVCPVKYCMDGSGEKLDINHDLCIGCGNCITSCSHNARRIIDDTDQFFGDLRNGTKMIAVVAPAIASVFPKKFLNFNGYLKSLGIEDIFDVSFGAELTVISYLNYIKEKKPRTLIAQPCPAIVSYIEIYRPKLLPYLAPAHSPMLHTIKMIHEYFPKYKNYKAAVISPCAAKRREFDATNLGDYNVTMLAVKEHLEANNINLASFPEVEYTGILAERAVGFSSPGGLLDTAERFIPGIGRQTRKIEGLHSIYPYLTDLDELLKNNTDLKLATLVDCLNCEKGCNGGPGTGNSKVPIAVLENPIRRRIDYLENFHKTNRNKKASGKYHKILNKYWKKGIYDRSYRNLSENNTIRHPNKAEISEVFTLMKKFTNADIYNCTACGYGTCEAMAEAIFNKLNKPENCLHFNHSLLTQDRLKMEKLNKQLHKHVEHAIGIIREIDCTIKSENERIDSFMNAINESSVITEEIVNDLQSTSELSRLKQATIQELTEETGKGQQSMKETILSVEEISQSIEGIASAIKIISSIAANTNLLSMNAAIEAAHAGEAGKGFAVVADEIRRLSENTRQNSQNISQTLSNIIKGIDVTSKRSGDTSFVINNMSKEIVDFAKTMTEMITTMGELSKRSSSITAALNNIQSQSTAVKEGFSDLLSKSSSLLDDMNTLSEVTDEKMSE
ncbi:MAG: methyl-accepting chemotaxis protein [Treponema sp.]|nr:methyl-accepting chemotaxis protein [Treponema sp.]